MANINNAKINIVMDRLKGSSYDSTTSQISINRGFVATGINPNLPFDVIRSAIVNGLPQLFSPHPTQGGAFVVGYHIALEGDTIAGGYVKYQTQPLPSGGKIDQFYFEKHSYLQSIETEIDPVYPAPSGGEQIHVNINGGDGNAVINHNSKGGPGDPDYYLYGSNQPGKLKYLRPVGVFTARGTFTKPPSSAVQSVLGCVNSDGNFLGLGTGFWLCHDISFSTHDGGNTYALTIQMMSFINEDWSSYLIGTDFRGRPLVIPPGVLAKLRRAKYAITPNYDNNNLSKYGLYNSNSFASTFGFPANILTAFSY